MSEWRVIEGDCLEVLRGMESESVDALVTDPPAGISFMGKGWDSNKGSRNQWIAWLTEVMEEALRVMKPGAHGLVWALPRTSHWTAMALEDAGFEVRDRIAHVFGSGYPKSASISKHIDKLARREFVAAAISLGVELPGRSVDDWTKEDHAPGDKWWEAFRAAIPETEWKRIEREVVARGKSGESAWFATGGDYEQTVGATEAAAQWEGWGTALKPSTEDWWLIRKPLSESSVARNVLRHGTGALNIDASRVGSESLSYRTTSYREASTGEFANQGQTNFTTGHKTVEGRWPSNLLLSHSVYCGQECHVSCPVKALDRQSGIRSAGGYPVKDGTPGTSGTMGKGWSGSDRPKRINTEAGGASRFFQRFPPEPDTGPGFQGELQEAYKARFCSGPPSSKAWKEADAHCKELEALRFSPDTGAGFLYQAKASRAERNKGLEGMPEKDAWASDKGDHGQFAVFEHDGRKRKPVQNIHPTVKSLSLMDYLVTLVTPPGGTCLDPFTGSGSTGCSAIRKGFNFIGIERDSEYAEIARRRIAYWRNPEPQKPKKKPKTKKPIEKVVEPDQMDLLSL